MRIHALVLSMAVREIVCIGAHMSGGSTGRIGVEPGVGALHGRVGPGAGNGQVQKMLGQVGASSTTTVPHPSVDRLPDDVNVWELVATVPPTGPSESTQRPPPDSAMS